MVDSKKSKSNRRKSKKSRKVRRLKPKSIEPDGSISTKAVQNNAEFEVGCFILKYFYSH